MRRRLMHRCVFHYDALKCLRRRCRLLAPLKTSSVTISRARPQNRAVSTLALESTTITPSQLKNDADQGVLPPTNTNGSVLALLATTVLLWS